MRILGIVAGILLFTSLGLSAQSDERSHPITRETFKVQLRVEKDQSLTVISFTTEKGKKRQATITSPGDMPLKQLRPGTIIEGTYRFSSFASEGGLGTTRIAKGQGKGDLKVSSIILDDPYEVKSSDYISQLAGVGDMAFRLK